jgi:hypothetical protein
MEKEEAKVNRSEINEHAATTLCDDFASSLFLFVSFCFVHPSFQFRYYYFFSDAPVILPTNPASQDSIGNGSSSSADYDDGMLYLSTKQNNMLGSVSLIYIYIDILKLHT